MVDTWKTHGRHGRHITDTWQSGQTHFRHGRHIVDMEDTLQTYGRHGRHMADTWQTQQTHGRHMANMVDTWITWQTHGESKHNPLYTCTYLGTLSYTDTQAYSICLIYIVSYILDYFLRSKIILHHLCHSPGVEI